MISTVPKVFISYRREETAGHAGRLYDVMSNRFGESNVFMDVDIAPGVDFVQRITEAVGGCHVLLVIMGPRWATIANGSSLARIFQPDDFVRLEVETAIRHSNVTVIPVLVGGAKMPDPTALPAPLRDLTRRNALELSDTRWRYDVDRLMGALDGLLADTSAVHKVVAAPITPPAGSPAVTPAPALAPRPPPEPRRTSTAGLAISTALIAAIAGFVSWAVVTGLRPAAPKYDHLVLVKGRYHTNWTQVKTHERTQHILDPVIWNGFTWAVIVGAVAIWLSLRFRGAYAVPGGLLTGALTGAVAGIVGSAVFAATPHLMNRDGKPSQAHHDLLLLLGAALTGAIAGAAVGWLWGRRASAGAAVGLLAGAFWEGILLVSGWSGPHGHVAKAGLGAFLIVGLVSMAMVLLDASEERSPRSLATSRGP
jgi:TIR domain-containing protein